MKVKSIPERTNESIPFSSLDSMIDLLHKGCAGYEVMEKRNTRKPKGSPSVIVSNVVRQVVDEACRHASFSSGALPSAHCGLADHTVVSDFTQVRPPASKDLWAAMKGGDLRGLISKLVESFRPSDFAVVEYVARLNGGALLRLEHLESVLRFARGFFEQSADVGFFNDYPYHGKIPLLQFRNFLLAHSQEDQGDFIAYGKWWSSTLLAKQMKQECEDPPVAGADLYAGLTGTLRIKLRNIVKFGAEGCRGRPLRMWKYLTSVQQLKRNFLPVDDNFVIKTLKKHKRAMMRPPGPMNVGTLLELVKTNDPLARRIKRVPAAPDTFVDAVTAKMRTVLKAFQPALPEMLQPSGSACFERGRGGGGSSQYLCDTYHDSPMSNLDDRYSQGLLLMMDYHPHHGTKSIYGIPYPKERDLIEETTRRNTRAVNWFMGDTLSNDGLDGRLLYERTYTPLEGPDVDLSPDNIHCRVAAVLEPAKVRTVTAGEALPYWISRSFQKSIHKYIRGIPQFSLCGQPLERWHLKFLDRLSAEYGCFQGNAWDGEKTVWVSGDYSGATDEIDIRLTRACHGLMMDRLRKTFTQSGVAGKAIEQYVDVLDSCIEPHVVEYPKNYVEATSGDEENLEACLQQNGQLMGSTLSFPILCIVNFCVGWLALYPHIEDYKMIPILVNGDDILFRCRESQYTVWCDHIKNAGFRRSVGKNFAHVDKIFINSQPWCARKRSDFAESKLCEFDYHPFFNTGLMHGQSKVAKKPSVEGESGGTYQALYSLQPEAVNGAQNRERAVRRFHSVNREHLRHASADGFFSYHAPREFYGLGMVPSEKARLTRTQQIMANVIIRSGLQLCKQGKLFIGDGRVSKPLHDLSRLNGPQMMYRGCIVPRCRTTPGARGFTVLQKLDHTELGGTQDYIGSLEDGPVMFASSWGLRKRVERELKSSLYREPYPEQLLLQGFVQLKLTPDTTFDSLEIVA